MKNRIKNLMVVLLMLAVPFMMNAQVTTTYPGTGGGTVLGDNNDPVGQDFILNVVSVEDQITDVDFGIDISHTFAGDIELTITSPAGTVVVMVDNQGGNDDDMIGTYDDESANANDAVGPIHGQADAQSLNPLSAFDGENPNGNWTFNYVDTAGGDVGTLNSWDLIITAIVSAPPPTIPTMGEWGLIIFTLLLLNLAIFYMVRRKRKPKLAST